MLGNLADELGVVARRRNDPHYNNDPNWPTGKYGSTWVLLCRREADLGKLANDKNWKPLEPDPTVRPWTDDFSNVVSVVNWRWDWDWLPGWNWWHPKDDDE